MMSLGKSMSGLITNFRPPRQRVVLDDEQQRLPLLEHDALALNYKDESGPSLRSRAEERRAKEKQDLQERSYTRQVIRREVFGNIVLKQRVAESEFKKIQADDRASERLYQATCAAITQGDVEKAENLLTMSLTKFNETHPEGGSATSSR